MQQPPLSAQPEAKLVPRLQLLLLLFLLPVFSVADSEDHFWAAADTICQGSTFTREASRCQQLQQLRQLGCYQRRATNWTGACPPSCPVLVSICGDEDWRCANEIDCGLLRLRGYVQQVDGVLKCRRLCRLKGCDHCQTDDRCKVCNAGFDLLENGLCRWKYLRCGFAVIGGFVLLVLYLVGSAIYMHQQGGNSPSNERAIQAGLQSRYRAKVMQFFKPQSPRYPLTVNMHCPEGGTVPICGPGMSLFMNWFILLAAVAVWLTALSWIFATTPTACQAAASTLLRENVHCYPWWTGLSYLGSLVISFGFFVRQRQIWVSMTHDQDGELPVQSFTVQALGFPPGATDKAALLEFFREGMRKQHLPPDAIEYISIAYGYSAEDAVWVNAAIDKHLEERQRSFELKHLAERSESSDEASVSTCPKQRPYAGPLWVQLAAYAFFGTEMDWPQCSETRPRTFEMVTPRDLSGKLNALPNSGTVYVVLRTQAIAIALQSYVHMPDTFGGHTIRLKLVDSAPQVTYWDKLSLSKVEKLRRGVISTVFVAGTVIFWFMCYAPTAWVYRMSVNAEGSTFLAMVQNAMALTIIIGNSMMAVVVAYLTDWIGFKRQATLLHARLLMLVPLMLLNVLCDMYWIVWKPSNEAFADDTFKSHATLVMEVHELVLGLLPSYCIVPYIGEPLVTVLGVFWVGLWRVKSDTRITPQQAERMLVASGTDIVNPPYCDFICTTTIIVSTFVISPSEAHKRIFPWLLVAAGVLYLQCRLRVLRWESRSYYGTNRLDNCEAAFWALPLGLLAAAWERNIFHVNSLVNPEVSFCGWRFFTMHVLMHQLFLKFVVPTMEPQAPASLQTYTEAKRQLRGHAGLADFLNANPVEVLKSHQEPELCTGQRLIFYRIDKEHLQERAVKDFRGEGQYALLVTNYISGDIRKFSGQAISQTMLFGSEEDSDSSAGSNATTASPGGRGLSRES